MKLRSTQRQAAAPVGPIRRRPLPSPAARSARIDSKFRISHFQFTEVTVRSRSAWEQARIIVDAGRRPDEDDQPETTAAP